MEYDLTSGLLAKRLGESGVRLSAATIQRYAREGRIPCKVTPGGRYRYHLHEVQQALAASSAMVSLARPVLTGGLGAGATVVRSAAAGADEQLRTHHSERIVSSVPGQIGRGVSAAVRDQVEHAAARAYAVA